MNKNSNSTIFPTPISKNLGSNGLVWLKLVDYGEYDHRFGMQVITRASAEKMVLHFRSLSQRLARRFRGIPIYIGHPDDPDFRGRPGHDDTRAYGWVKDLEARDDGLWIHAKWSKAGQELLDNAFFKFLSPRWEMEMLGNSRFSPKQLISIGLTNHPNIAMEAIANQESVVPSEDPIKSEEARMDNTESRILRNDPPSLLQQIGRLLELDDLSELNIVAAIQNLKDCERQLKSKIQSNSCSDTRKPLHSISCTLNLLERNFLTSGQARGQQLLSLVHGRMESKGENFSQAWFNVKSDYPEFFCDSTNL